MGSAIFSVSLRHQLNVECVRLAKHTYLKNYDQIYRCAQIFDEHKNTVNLYGQDVEWASRRYDAMWSGRIVG